MVGRVVKKNVRTESYIGVCVCVGGGNARVTKSKNFPDSKIFVAKTFRIKRVNLANFQNPTIQKSIRPELLKSFIRSFDYKPNIQESSKSVAWLSVYLKVIGYYNLNI